ncbi:HutP family protein [Candidatus Formimonas warabiya]|uniref:Hut operon positive regulatory protein n=1 Tax=Formimonas warabiya TaxID=1761012 RepID=A0A3G1KZ49_FORW1|nr:HutP family protein [Candidatus Formimonas warabiya]ATW27485.1 hypothetical protein DCMF_24465 [Candidatus Formimonas warabiya]
MKRIGRLATLLVLASEEEREKMMEKRKKEGLRICIGKVGTMHAEKIISAVMTAAKREEIWNGESFKEEHALYAAIMESLHGICRGQLIFNEALRTVGLTFSIVRGQMLEAPGDWVAVCLYGTIGPPIKGFEHEVLGLGINHI